MILRHIISDSCGAERKGFSAIAKTMIVYGIISILLHGLVFSAPVLAGTETGEFCPTCPDWNDMDGWLAKKAAYDQEQQQKTSFRARRPTLKTQNVEPARSLHVNDPVSEQLFHAPDRQVCRGACTSKRGLP